MNILKYVPKGATMPVGRTLLKLQKSSPTTLFVAGAVGVVATAVMASRATLKAQEVLETAKVLDDQGENIEHLTNKEKVNVAVSLAKIYTPTILVGGLTIGALTGSHRILTTRNASITAAYTALNDAYDKYQQRVAEEIGHEKAAAIKNDLQEKTFTENGKTVKYKAAGGRMPSQYARFYDEGCSSWQRSAESNLLFLRCQQDYLNNKLRARGHLFLNEVYDALGMERTGAGQVVGWLVQGDGDKYVDFGLYNDTSPEVRAFVNGSERSVLLDFNVDGLIYELIDKN